MKIELYLLALVFLLTAVWLMWQAARRQRASGLPVGKVIYVDTHAWSKVEAPLFDAQLGLTGKPDYLVQQGDTWLPVEVKSSWAPPEPHPGHLLQLAAYCWLAQTASGVRPPYGIIQYRNRTFQVEYTEELEEKLLEVVADIRAQERRGEAHRSHDTAIRCARCGFRSLCDQRL